MPLVLIIIFRLYVGAVYCERFVRQQRIIILRAQKSNVWFIILLTDN